MNKNATPANRNHVASSNVKTTKHWCKDNATLLVDVFYIPLMQLDTVKQSNNDTLL